MADRWNDLRFNASNGEWLARPLGDMRRALADLLAERDALAAAGLVVRPADEHERIEWGWSDDCCNRPVLVDDGDWPDDPDDKPLYVRKEPTT